MVSDNTLKNNGVYSATKSFNVYFSDYLNAEYGSNKLDILYIKPGVVVTNFM